MNSPFERGEVYWFDFRGSTGSERDDVSPAIVLQTNWIRGFNTVLCVPCSAEVERRKQPTCVFVPSSESGLPHDSVALCHLLSALDKSRVQPPIRPVGRLPEQTLQKILLIVAELLEISAETFLAGRDTDPGEGTP